MRDDYTHISVILDRSGSMQAIRDDIIGGFNAFLEEQQAGPGMVTFTLVQFDLQDPYELVHHFKPIGLVPKLTRATYVPRAGTPLLDALGRGINDLEATLAKLDERDRPARVVFAVITDGRENSSKEFRKDQIVRMVEERQEQDDWQFVFLSADLEAIRDAWGYGFRQARAMAFDRDRRGVRHAFDALSSRVTDYRTARTSEMTFTEEDRKKQTSESGEGE